MSNSRIRDVAAAGSQAVSDPSARRAGPAEASTDNIVQRALSILDEESRDWLQAGRRPNSVSPQVGPDPGSTS